MSNVVHTLDAEIREDLGKGASRRLRRTRDFIPAIIYGGKEAPAAISLDHKKILKAVQFESFFSNILSINLNNKVQKVVLKDLQRHPYKPFVQHIDFLRVADSDIITMKIPVHFINENICPGVKEGGIINHLAIDLEVKCKAKDLPEYIEIDLANLELDQAIHLSEIKLPKGVEIPALSHGKSYDASVVNVHLPRQAKADANDDATNEAANKSEEKK